MIETARTLEQKNARIQQCENACMYDHSGITLNGINLFDIGEIIFTLTQYTCIKRSNS